MIWQGTSLIDDSVASHPVIAESSDDSITFGEHTLRVVSPRPTHYRAVHTGTGEEYALRKTSITVTRYTANCGERTYIANRVIADSFASIFSSRREIRAVNLEAFGSTGPDYDISATNAPGTYTHIEPSPDAVELGGIAADPNASAVVARTAGKATGDLELSPAVAFDDPVALDLVFISWALTFVDTPSRRTLY